MTIAALPAPTPASTARGRRTRLAATLVSPPLLIPSFAAALLRAFKPRTPPAPAPVRPMTPASSHGAQAAPPRIPQLALLFVTVVLLAIAELSIPGGLTPRRIKHRILSKRVAERLDLISPSDPNVIEPGGPLPIDTIHRTGRVHRGVWLFALDSHLRLLLAWRSPGSPACPLTWATLAEHAVTNESFDDAAYRGLAEEARFIARPRVHPVGTPFMYRHVQPAKHRPPRPRREERQWTQAYVILPRGDAVDFRELDDHDALATQVDGELDRYQGMAIPDFVRHAVQRPSYFCHSDLARWMLSVIPLVVRVLKSHERRLFRGYLRDEWATLVASGSPVCCRASEHDIPIESVNMSVCGVPCEEGTIDPSDVATTTTTTIT